MKKAFIGIALFVMLLAVVFVIDSRDGKWNTHPDTNEQVSSDVSANTSSGELTDNSEMEATVSNTGSKPSDSPGGITSEETSSKPDDVHKHSYVKKVVKPTCTKDGYTKYTCDCGKTYKDKETEKLGHDYTEWKTTKKATTTAEGVQTRTCERCGITKNKNIPKKEGSANVDSRIEVSTRFGITSYTLKKCCVDDRRTWGEAPTITVGDDDSMHVTYYNKKGEKIQFTVKQPAKDDVIIRFNIFEDGTYNSQRIGAFA